MKDQKELPLTQLKPCVQIFAIMTENSEYDIAGKGILEIVTDEIDQESYHYLQVKQPLEGSLVMRSRLSIENKFEKQKGSVICWTDAEQKSFEDLALSFENDEECDFYWRLICQRVGKNYLDICSTETLELPTEQNLPSILEKVKNNKDMIHYHIINSTEFMLALSKIFQAFSERNDKMGMGMISRIIKAILLSLDLKLIQVFLSDPVFELLLSLQKFHLDIDFLKNYQEKVKIKTLMNFKYQISNKILLIHRANYYRENVLDLSKQNNLESILIMAVKEYYHDILNYLAKDHCLEELVEMELNVFDRDNLTDIFKKQITQDNGVLINQQETLIPQNEIAKKIFNESKVEFLLEAFFVYKQVNTEKVRVRFLEKIYSSKVLLMLENFIDQNIVKALEVLICISQANPTKFFDYIRLNFRNSPSNNLHKKMSKKYCTSPLSFQHSILEVLKTFYIIFSTTKQFSSFFNGTFLYFVLESCKDETALLNIIIVMAESLSTFEGTFSLVLKCKVFQKILKELKEKRINKMSQLSVVKILKLVLIQNLHLASEKTAQQKRFLQKLNGQLITTGFFDYCMGVLERNLNKYNIFSSSMLENLSLIERMQYSVYHEHLTNNFQVKDSLTKYLAKIYLKKPYLIKAGGEDEFKEINKVHHEIQLQNEEIEDFLLAEGHDEIEVNGLNISAQLKEKQDQLEHLKRIRMEIQNEELEEIPVDRLKKFVKKSEEIPTITFDFDIDFENEQPEGMK